MAEIEDEVGGLVGWLSNGGSITASYATGPADGGNGNFRMRSAGWWASWQNGRFDHGELRHRHRRLAGMATLILSGGLVGQQADGVITASYATGIADGGNGENDTVGGLVGVQSGGSIRASYGFGES